MHRLFVALRPPLAVRQRLASVMHGVEGARWQDDDQLHITLRFIGEVDRHQAQDVAAILSHVHAPPVELRLEGVGTFERRGRIDTLWAGVTPAQALHPLHKKIDRACQSVGLEPERRAYFPHLTLARMSHPSGPIEPFLAREAGLGSSPFTLENFALYESHLGRSGATYHLVERYPLTLQAS